MITNEDQKIARLVALANQWVSVATMPVKNKEDLLRLLDLLEQYDTAYMACVEDYAQQIGSSYNLSKDKAVEAVAGWPERLHEAMALIRKLR